MTRYTATKSNTTIYTKCEVWYAMIRFNLITCPECDENIDVGDTSDRILECNFNSCSFRCKTSVYISEKVNKRLIRYMRKKKYL